MIATNTDRLYAGYDSLKSICTSLSTQGHAISDVRRQLLPVSGMDGICRSIQAMMDNVDLQIEQCKKLYQSLDMICQTYVACENRVLNHCEGTLIHYAQPPIGFMDLASTTNLLREFSFSLDSGGDSAWP